jgi:hypothetical protein
MAHRLRRSTALAAVTALLSALSIAVSHPAAASPPPAATFNPNLLLKGSSSAAEPSIRTDQFGQSFVIAPIGVPAGCKAFRVRHDGSASDFLGFPDHTAGGGDCDWAIGPQETSPTIIPPSTDNVLPYSSLTLANITTGKSDDGGATFGVPNPYSQQVAGDDRMWMDADPKLNAAGLADIFMIYHDVNIGNIQLGVSIDGGFSYVQQTPTLINPAEVPQGQWQVVGLSPGNFIGNIVAHRPKGGALTLYSIFETPDSATDNVNQGIAGTANYNRVYEAVGTVTDSPAGTPATIVWNDYEIYHGPIGANYGRLFPITVVDNAGKVYAFFSDGNHILTKSDATGTGWNPAAAPVQIPNPTFSNGTGTHTVNTAIMPWAAAGKGDIVDVVFYGAYGGTGAQPDPQDDPNNVWNTFMAQTIDGGSSWGVFRASDHNIHQGDICIHGLNCDLLGGDRTLLDFFQVSIDPTNGAADIAYADDSGAPGNAVLYFTRQCTGASATTGTALVNDCKAPTPPPPPPQGNSCPGPQILDFVNDAPNNYPAGMGQNMDNLDIESVAFTQDPSDSNNIQITMTIKDLEAPPTTDNPNYTSALWTVYWQQTGSANPPTGTNWWYAQLDTFSNAVLDGTDGTFDQPGDSYTFQDVITVDFNAGANGAIVFHVPKANVGAVNGAVLTNTFSDTAGAFLILGGGLRYIARGDRAPDSGFGANYTVGQTCTPVPPGTVPATLTLAPKTETDNVGTQACVTATVKDSSGNPVPSIVVPFTVTGANPQNASETTDAFGQAQFCYTGQNTGADNISAFADYDKDGVNDGPANHEPSDTAAKTWVNQVTTPTCEVKITNGGWIKASNGDKGTFGGNAKSSATRATSGQEQYQDHGPAQPLNVHSINVQSINCNSTFTEATIEGQATINGSGSYHYTITVQDNGSSGSSDAYGITLSNGYSSGLRALKSGNVDIHKSS